jgi:hypothetical protein
MPWQPSDCDRLDTRQLRPLRLAKHDAVTIASKGSLTLLLAKSGNTRSIAALTTQGDWQPLELLDNLKWLRCPETSCGKRVRVLYRPPNESHFACRTCKRVKQERLDSALAQQLRVNRALKQLNGRRRNGASDKQRKIKGLVAAEALLRQSP